MLSMANLMSFNANPLRPQRTKKLFFVDLQ